MRCSRRGLAGIVAAAAIAPAAVATSALAAGTGRSLTTPSLPRAMGARETAATSCPAEAAARPGSQLWVSQSSVVSRANAMAVSPDGSTVYITGTGGGSAYNTIAYNTRTGRLAWSAQYDIFGAGGGPVSLAVSPDGSKLFVTGLIDLPGLDAGSEVVTVAYGGGTLLWQSIYHVGHDDVGYSVAVSPNGTRVFVTGASTGPAGNEAYLTIAYSAYTGRQRWVRLYNGPASDDGEAKSVAVSPDGTAVYVTGSSARLGEGYNFATIAYTAATGATLWTRRYDGTGKALDRAISVGVSPGGGAVYVTGTSTGLTSGYDYATIAYAAATGATLWKRRYNGPFNGNDEASAQAISPDGSTVVVTGTSAVAGFGRQYATVAYDSATGATRWGRRYVSPASDNRAMSAAFSPDASTVYVTGASLGCGSGDDYATIAYDATTGAPSWLRRYNTSSSVSDVASVLAVAPATGIVLVTGSSGAGDSISLTTVAYSR